MSHYYGKFKENPCVGTDASTPLERCDTNLSSAAVVIGLLRVKTPIMAVGDDKF